MLGLWRHLLPHRSRDVFERWFLLGQRQELCERHRVPCDRHDIPRGRSACYIISTRPLWWHSTSARRDWPRVPPPLRLRALGCSAARHVVMESEQRLAERRAVRYGWGYACNRGGGALQ